MSEAIVAATDGGDATFDHEFEAARAAEAEQGDDAQAGEGEDEELDADAEAAAAKKAAKEAKAKEPLPVEELQKRLIDQKGAMRTEREKRKLAESRAADLEARLSAIERRTAAPADGESAPLTRPDPQEDPIGYLEYVEQRLSAADAQTAEQQAAQQQQEQQAQQVKALVDRVAEHEEDFRELHPDYDEATNHLYDYKIAEYVESGYSPDRAHMAVMNEFLTRSNAAMAAGKNPAEIAYNMAKKAGYGAKAATGKLDAIERGQRATSPLAGGGGRGASELSEDAVANLSGAAFDKAFEKLQARARAIERSSGL